MRPGKLDEVVGQEHLLAHDAPLRLLLESGRIPSMVFWGPPGVGKTTLARLVAQHVDACYLTLSAVMSGVKDIRESVSRAQAEASGLCPRPTVLFIDEIHRFNKAQQDALLPFVEDGTLTLVGATTENPSFELNGALLSRLRVFVLKSLDDDALCSLIRRATVTSDVKSESSDSPDFPPEWISRIAEAADGDARRALVLVETAQELIRAGGATSEETLVQLLGRAFRRFDKGGDYFYDQISALHKSVRGSDPDAALYWFARMIDGGCDPRYLARRITRMAYEDVGLAEPGAIRLCLDAWDAYERLGSPEGELALAQAVVYLSSVPKSNAVYSGLAEATATVNDTGSLEVPLHLRNAPTRLMRELGHGEGYRYDHAEEGAHAAGQQFLPDALAGRQFYKPGRQGLEAKISDRLNRMRGTDQNDN